MEMMMQNLMLRGAVGNNVSASGGKVSQSDSSKEGDVFSQMLNGMKEQALAKDPQSQPGDAVKAEPVLPEAMAQMAVLWLQMPQSQIPLEGVMLHQPEQSGIEGALPVSLTEVPQNSAGIKATQNTPVLPEAAAGVKSETIMGVETGHLTKTEQAVTLSGMGSVQTENLKIPREGNPSQASGSGEKELQVTEGAGMKAAVPEMSKESGEGKEMKNQQDTSSQPQLPGGTSQMQEIRQTTGADRAVASHGAEETLVFRESTPVENIQKLSSLIEKTVTSGVREIEVQLEPAHLGKIVIKASYELGKASVLITCSSDKTADILSHHAAELGGILRDRMGSPTQIVLERQPEQYLDQNGHGGQQAGADQEEHREQQQKKDRRQALKSDFLQQLRLGIV